MPNPTSAVAELRKSYEEWAPTRRLIQWAREIEATPEETPTADLSRLLHLKSADAKDLFKGIDKLGLGKFIVGRRTHPSRLQGQYTLPSIAAVATGEADAFEPVGRNSLPGRDAASQLIEY